MKYTLLEMVQDVLSSMDGDEVNSITDTTEAMQIARVIRSSYFDIVSDHMPEHTTLFQLEPSGDSTKPVIMYLPSDVHNLITLKYDCQKSGDVTSNFTTVRPLSVDDFFRMTFSFSLADSNVASMSHTIDTGSFTLLYRNDKSPQYYTCIDDHTFFFDSYDSVLDTTLQKNKTWCLGEKEHTFTLTDTYTIDLDENQHIWLLNEAKVLAFEELLQMQHQKAAQTAKRQKIKAQKTKFVNNDPTLYYSSLPIYGRRKNRNTTPALIMH